MNRLTVTYSNGVWGIKDLPWADISEGAVVTRATEEKLTMLLCKLKDYENSDSNSGETALTNADRIRAMSDEELADFFHNIVHYEEYAEGGGTDTHLSVQFADDEKDTDMLDDYGDILEWLRKAGK